MLLLEGKYSVYKPDELGLFVQVTGFVLLLACTPSLCLFCLVFQLLQVEFIMLK